MRLRVARSFASARLATTHAARRSHCDPLAADTPCCLILAKRGRPSNPRAGHLGIRAFYPQNGRSARQYGSSRGGGQSSEIRSH